MTGLWELGRCVGGWGWRGKGPAQAPPHSGRSSPRTYIGVGLCAQARVGPRRGSLVVSGLSRRGRAWGGR